MNRGPQRVNEQSKDFFGALKRLFSELKSFRVALTFKIFEIIIWTNHLLNY